VPVTVPDAVASITVRELARRIWHRRWIVACLATVVFILVAAYTFRATPRFRSAARLRIDTQSQGASGVSALADQATSALPGAGLLGLGRDELETEIAVLRSDRVADATIDSLALNVRVTSPASSRAAILTARVLQTTVDADGTLTLTRTGSGHYRVVREKLEDTPGIPAEIIPGVPVQVGGTSITLLPTLLTAGPSRIEITIMPRYEVHKLLARRLLIAQQEGGSRLVEVSFEDADRTLAAQVVNTTVNEYVAFSTTTERAKDTTTVGHLRLQVDSTSRKLAAAEAALRSFEERSRLIAPEDQATAQVKRMGVISAQVDAISTERNALARMLALIQQRSRGGADASAYRQLATFPSLITNRAIQDLLQSLVDLENKQAELGVRRTAANAEYKQFTDRITEIERQLYAVGPQYLESLDQQLAMTVRTVTALGDTLQIMPGAAMQYGRLLRDRTLLEAIYLALQKQLKQAELRDVLRQDKVKVVDVARVANPHDVAFPKKGVMLALGAVLGLTLALTAALFAELWSQPPAPDFRATT
jgi:succinoglycan biosynthesis transport protein ExoP